MKSNIYRLWLASSFSLSCLLAPKIATAQNNFLSINNSLGSEQQISLKSVTYVTQNLNIHFTTNATYIGKTTNNPKRNVANTNSENAEFKSLESKARTGLEAKGGKKPPRKG